MATLLIIGGTGFFGKSILDVYQRGGLSTWKIDHVIAMSRNAEKLKITNPELINGSVELISADIATLETLPYADYVIHAAASSDAKNYVSQPDKERHNIQAGTNNYCLLAQKFHSESKIVYVSSGAVYGKQSADLSHISEDYIIQNYESIPEAKRDYAIAKRDAEQAIIDLGAQGLLVSIARCFAFVGKYLPRDKHFAIGNFIADGLASRTIVVKAKHQVFRSYMYADDLVNWLMTIAESSKTSCPIFNVGSPKDIEVRVLAQKVADYFNVDCEVSSQVAGEVDRYVPSVIKAKLLLKLDIKFDLDQAIRESSLLV